MPPLSFAPVLGSEMGLGRRASAAALLGRMRKRIVGLGRRGATRLVHA